MEKKKKMQVESTTLNEVPADERKSWWQVAFIEMGIYICVPCLMLGGMMINGMTLKNAVIAALAGYILAAVIMSFSGMMGADYGRPTAVIAKSSFGGTGARVVMSVVFSLSSFGWFAVQNAVCGKAFSAMMKDGLGIDFPIWLSIILWGVIMLVTAVQGIDGLKWLNNIAVPLLFVVFFVGMIMCINKFGTENLSSGITGESMSIFDGMVLTASLVASGTVIRPDISRYQRTRGGVWSATFIGMVPAGVALMAIGAVLTKLTGEYDITVVLSAAGVPALGLIGLILATWTTNTSNAYCAGLSIVMMLNLKEDKRAIATLVAGVIGTVIALTPLVNSLEAFVTLLGTTYFPISGVMLADYWIVRKGSPSNFSYERGFNIAGFIAWILGVIVSELAPLGLFVGFITAGIIYVILCKIIPSRNVITGLGPVRE